MKIHFLTSAHNSLSQRLLAELTERGHAVTVAVVSNEEAMVKSVEDQAPDLIIAPMLKAKVPQAIWSKHICLIVHPGILGDRGPSSLDWAIAMGERTWGVTILQAAEEMDAGPIWATRNFSQVLAHSRRSIGRDHPEREAIERTRRAGDQIRRDLRVARRRREVGMAEQNLDDANVSASRQEMSANCAATHWRWTGLLILARLRAKASAYTTLAALKAFFQCLAGLK